MRALITPIAFTALIAVCTPAAAVLVVADDAVHGVGSLTTDTDTGLSWLDMDLSIGYSYNDIGSEFAAGGAFEGFRLATRAEVTTLWSNAGIPDIDVGGTAANEAPVLDLINDFIGATSVQGTQPESFGFTADLTPAGTSVYRAVLDWVGGTDVYDARTSGSQGVSVSFSTFGAWLVRGGGPTTTASEPLSASLLALGLLGVASRAARRRRDRAAG